MMLIFLFFALLNLGCSFNKNFQENIPLVDEIVDEKSDVTPTPEPVKGADYIKAIGLGVGGLAITGTGLCALSFFKGVPPCKMVVENMEYDIHEVSGLELKRRIKDWEEAMKSLTFVGTGLVNPSLGRVVGFINIMELLQHEKVSSEDTLSERYRYFLAIPKGGSLLAASVEGAMVTSVFDNDFERYLRIELLATAPWNITPYVGRMHGAYKGVGTAFLKFAKTEMEKKEYNGILGSPLPEAKSFYENALKGFKSDKFLIYTRFQPEKQPELTWPSYLVGCEDTIEAWNQAARAAKTDLDMFYIQNKNKACTKDEKKCIKLAYENGFLGKPGRSFYGAFKHTYENALKETPLIEDKIEFLTQCFSDIPPAELGIKINLQEILPSNGLHSAAIKALLSARGLDLTPYFEAITQNYAPQDKKECQTTIETYADEFQKPIDHWPAPSLKDKVCLWYGQSEGQIESLKPTLKTKWAQALGQVEAGGKFVFEYRPETSLIERLVVYGIDPALLGIDVNLIDYYNKKADKSFLIWGLIALKNSPLAFINPLYFAVSKGDHHLLRALLSIPHIEVNEIQKEYYPLIEAAYAGDYLSVRSLLAHPRINVSIRDKDGDTALKVARGSDVKKLLQEAMK